MRESTETIKCQTTFPKDVLKVLCLQPGDKMRYILRDGEVRILTVRPVLDFEDALKRSGQKTVTLEEMDEAIAAGAVEQR
jgi:bifunctional DNA-binding transcriptional regulator/antitoxin component of YhaV-PrlF toxin-antitoxin module